MRNTARLNENISIAWGDDEALGYFFQIFDKRLEEKIDEGLIFDADSMFGVNGNNVLGLNDGKGEMVDIYIRKGESLSQEAKEHIIKLCDNFYNSEDFQKMSTLAELEAEIELEYQREVNEAFERL